MVKRAATPEQADDYKYFTVVNPYPLHLNPVIDEERIEFAHWVAAIVPQDYITAIFYRPVAPNLILVEVLKSCPTTRTNAFLGAHKWSEFLKSPTEEESELVSKVFYCTHDTDRKVQKHGWKRLDVQEYWFGDYNPTGGLYRFGVDYPRSTFCEPPPPTQAEFAPCRPLPVDVFPVKKPPPPVSRVIVPGSEKYNKSKEDGTYALPTTTNTKSQKAWSKAAKPPSRALSSNTSSADSWDNDSVQFVMNNASSLPPGLVGPGIASQASSSDESLDFEPIASAVMTSDAIPPAILDDVTDQMQRTNLNNQENLWGDYSEQQSERSSSDAPASGGKLWYGQPKRATDWDKLICPEHKIKCSGTCEVYAKLKKERKRQEERASSPRDRENREGGWNEAKSKGRGRGRGQGAWGRGKSINGASRRGGWC